jgi:predicted GNAT family N-acyltransferase
MALSSDSSLSLNRIRPYNLISFSKYLNIRYKVFIKEMGRRAIFEEFNPTDLKAYHYILKAHNEVIGTVRLIYKNENTVQIGRVAILKEFRNKGYGGIIVNKLLELIKKEKQASLVVLYSEDDKVNFYKRLGFIENGKIFDEAEPLTYMIMNI